jgi:hypothetical protein
MGEQKSIFVAVKQVLVRDWIGRPRDVESKIGISPEVASLIFGLEFKALAIGVCPVELSEDDRLPELTSSIKSVASL